MGISNLEASSSSITNRGFLVVGVLVALLVLTPFLGGDVTGEAVRKTVYRAAFSNYPVEFSSAIQKNGDGSLKILATPKLVELQYSDEMGGASVFGGTETISRNFIKCNEKDSGEDPLKKSATLYKYKSLRQISNVQAAAGTKKYKTHTLRKTDRCLNEVKGTERIKMYERIKKLHYSAIDGSQQAKILVEYTCQSDNIKEMYIFCEVGCSRGVCAKNYINPETQAMLDSLNQP